MKWIDPLRTARARSLKMVCAHCLIDVDRNPSWVLLPEHAPLSERDYTVTIAEYTQHMWESHMRASNYIADENLARLALHEYDRPALAAAQPHGRCTPERCFEHAQDRRVPSCHRGKGRRRP